MASSLLSIARRDVLAFGISGVALSTVPTAVQAAVKRPATPSIRLAKLLDSFAEEILRLEPTQATSLGLDSGARLALKSRLSDTSPAGDAKWTAQVQSMLSRLATINRDKLTPAEQLRYDTAKHAATVAVEGTSFFNGSASDGFFGGAVPYPVTQQDGVITSTPDFLDAQHAIRNGADAEAYLARVAAFARALDDESGKIAAQAGRGVMPPNFIAKTALGQLMDYRATPIAQQTLVRSLVDRTAKLGIKGAWASRVTKMVETLVYPALDRQIAALSKASANAPDTAGVHRLPDGEAYYRWALKLGTTTNATAEEIHALGLEQNKAIQSRMDAILKSQGMTQGSVGERLIALTKDPKMLYADDQAGREALIAFCNEKVAAMRLLMPKMSRLGMKAPLVVKRVPEDIQAGAALGYMNFASLDGSRPAIYYINLKSTTLWPKYQLTTLTAHEGVPGHAWQGAYLAENQGSIPLLASLTGFNAFIEGWALYAEQLCDEFGLYNDDPFGQLGYLQAQQFRACRLVVDTGLHALKWTREQAIQFLVENTGRGQGAMTSEIDRYCVSPGQACGYKMGHNEILRLRDKAKAALGAKFDVATFNDAIVKTGGVPLTVLATAIDQYVARAKGVG